MYLPVYVLDREDTVPLPGGSSYLEIPLSKVHFLQPATVEDSKTGKQIQQIVIVLAKEGTNWVLMRDIKELSTHGQSIGVLCSVETREQTDDFELVTIRGECRVHTNALSISETQGEYPIIEVILNIFQEEFLPEEEKLREDVNNMCDLLVENSRLLEPSMTKKIQSYIHLTDKMDVIADTLLKSQGERLRYLQEKDNYERWDLLLGAIKKKVSTGKKRPARKKTKSQVSTRPPSPPRTSTGRTNFKQRLNDSPMPEESRETIAREINRLESLSKSSTESSMLTDYLDWVLSVPWGVSSYSEFNLGELRTILDSTHHGLDDVKDHLLEHMCIERLRGGSAGTVLCFVGEPGTGKTTIAAQIAKASGRKLQRIALGGLSDEAEIRGHRRTYVASKPGRFIQGLRQAGSMDPLFLLDEVDKIARHKGDPTSALLEVLDPEQNHQFTDRYLETPVDMSKAMFICTANEEKDIPEALRDRMEMIYFRKYTYDERYVITRDFLIPKVRKSYCMLDMPIDISQEVLDDLCKITQIRQIEKTLGKLLRKAAVQVHVYKKEEQEIDKEFATPVFKNKKVDKRQIGFGRSDDEHANIRDLQ